MKKFIAILTGCSLALALSVQAAKPDDAGKKPAAKPKAAPKQQVAPPQRTAPKPRVEAAPKAPKKQERTLPAVQSEKPANVEAKKLKPDKASKLDKATAPDRATSVVTDEKLRKDATKTTAKSLKLPSEKLNQIKTKHASFKAKPSPAITSAQFNPNYRIEAAQNWTGPQYEVFRSYQPQWHDRSWWTSRYTTISLIGGGWYYWDAGYWYPAWGYDDAANYYPYDGPIYVGSNPRPFDQVVADVQAVLQEQGFYRGEVDGLLGPLTREALASYQAAAGLPATAAIDQPTLDYLGLS